MHKTYLNFQEVKIIKNANKICDIIGGFPAMENAKLINYNSSLNKSGKIDIELVFDITGWVDAQNEHYRKIKNEEYKEPYKCNNFPQRIIKITLSNCLDMHIDDFGCIGGEIKFGGKEQCEQENRYQDGGPSIERILDGPYCCLYRCNGRHFFIHFDENECEIKAELV